MSARGLQRVAAEFNQVYVELGALQRRLVEAVSSGADESSPAVQRLIAEAESLTAALHAARAPSAAPAPPTLETEASALRAVVMRPPLDGHLLMAAFRAQPPTHAFPLIADALAAVSGSNGDRSAIWGTRMVVDLLGAPRGMDLTAARRMADRLGLEGHAPIAELSAGDQARLVAGLRDDQP